MAAAARPERKIRLEFRRQDERAAGQPAAVIRGDLSACALTGDCLWFGCDETTTVERLIRQEANLYADHRSYQLAEIFSLPAGPGEEIDIEGLAADGGYLWITGSHSSKRRKPKRHENDPAEAMARLSTISIDPNRYFLARVPVVATGGGIHGLAGFDGLEAVSGNTAACLAMGSGRNTLVDALGADDLLGRFVDIPSKDNGLDIEGIAARGNRVYLGLRGPVLRGWATIIELVVTDEAPGVLGMGPVGRDGRPFTKHMLDLDGLGIRDLAFVWDALLILAGPTMDLDGPVRLYRWPRPLEATDYTVITHDRLELILNVPFGDGVDHAEGMALLGENDRGHRLMVIYDSPDPARLHGDGTAIDADVFALPIP